MNRSIEIKKALEIWADNCFEKLPHLSMEKLYQLSLPGGMQNVDKSDIEHLSLCPICLSNWETCASMHDISADEYEKDQEDVVLGWGFLEAASDGFVKPLYMKSSCKRFMLGIFPEINNLKRGMAVIEVLSDKDENLEGMIVSVQDAAENKIISGKIKLKRTATKIKDLTLLDLSKWTVVLSKSKENKDNE